MFKAMLARARQGHRTIAYPDGPAPALSDRFRGLLLADAAKCPTGCRDCVDACPTRAIATQPGRVRIDLGRCLFCAECVDACPESALCHTAEFRMAARARPELVSEGSTPTRLQALDEASRRLFGRSLKLRQVSAGGCNGCEAEVAVLQTVVYDLGRFGISLVASPRHADGLLITGPVTANMRRALKATWDAVPAPKLVIAVGACAISGGPYAGHPEQHDGAESTVPVDLFIPGCPPHPLTILDGLLRLLGRIEDQAAGSAPPGSASLPPFGA